MLGYITIGSNDLPRATAFFDALLAVTRFMRGTFVILMATSSVCFT